MFAQVRKEVIFKTNTWKFSKGTQKGAAVPLVRNEERRYSFFLQKERRSERVPEIRGPNNALQVCHHFIYVSLKLKTVRKETTKASSVLTICYTNSLNLCKFQKVPIFYSFICNVKVSLLLNAQFDNYQLRRF